MRSGAHKRLGPSSLQMSSDGGEIVEDTISSIAIAILRIGKGDCQSEVKCRQEREKRGLPDSARNPRYARRNSAFI
jgi:hypothetical protein